MKNPFLIGPRVYLRSLEVEDAPLFTEWLNDPEVRRFLDRLTPISLHNERLWIEKQENEPSALGLSIVKKDGDELLGGAGLRNIDAVNRHAQFGIFIGRKEAWSQGFGSEATRLILDHAFATLNLNRVALQVYEFNSRARKTYEKVGFVLEGTMRQERYRDGRYWDTHVMSILRDDWIAGKGRA